MFHFTEIDKILLSNEKPAKIEECFVAFTRKNAFRWKKDHLINDLLMKKKTRNDHIAVTMTTARE